MPEFFAILAAICAVVSSIFGVKNRLRNRGDRGSSSRTGSYLRNEGSGYNDAVSRDKQLDRVEERLQECSSRDTGISERCKQISSRISKREPETSDTE